MNAKELSKHIANLVEAVSLEPAFVSLSQRVLGPYLTFVNSLDGIDLESVKHAELYFTNPKKTDPAFGEKHGARTKISHYDWKDMQERMGDLVVPGEGVKDTEKYLKALYDKYMAKVQPKKEQSAKAAFSNQVQYLVETLRDMYKRIKSTMDSQIAEYPHSAAAGTIGKDTTKRPVPTLPWLMDVVTKLGKALSSFHKALNLT